MSQQYLLPCVCGQKLRVGNAQAGEQVTCVCGTKLHVPTLRGIRQLEPAPALANVKSAPGWSPVQGGLFAMGLLAAAIGLVTVAYAGYQYALIVYSQHGDLSQDRTAEVITAMSTNVEKLTAPQMLDVWSEEIIKDGLGEAHTPIWIAAKEKLTQLYWRAIAGAATIAGGLVVSLGAIYLVGRR